MIFLLQLGIIFLFAIVGEVFVSFVPGGLPATVMGMVFLLFALWIKLLKPKHILECADYLSKIMAFFFLPAIAAIILNFDMIIPIVWQLLFIAIVCTFITFFAAYSTVRALRLLLGKRK